MGNQAGIIIRNVKKELFHSAKRLILNEVKGIECLPLIKNYISTVREVTIEGEGRATVSLVDKLVEELEHPERLLE